MGVCADVFAICMSYEKESELSELSYRFRKEIREIIPEFEMIPVFGFYLIKDLKMEVNDMYDNAKLATRSAKEVIFRIMPFIRMK